MTGLEWHVVGVCGRGFPGASPPSIRVTVLPDAGDPSSRNAAQVVIAGLPGERQPVGDIFWELERSVRWADQNQDDSDLDNDDSGRGNNSMGGTLKLRVVGAGSIQFHLVSGGQEAAQEWQTLGKTEQGLQVKLILKEVSSKRAIEERHRRRMRILQKELELHLVKTVPPEKLEAWEAKRRTSSAKKIQIHWRQWRASKTEKRGTFRTGILGSSSRKTQHRPAFCARDKIHAENLETDDREDTDYSHFDSDHDSGAENREEEDEETEDAAKEDFARLEEKLEQITRECLEGSTDDMRYVSTHEKYEYLIGQSDGVQNLWERLNNDLATMEANEAKRNRTLRQLKRINQLAQVDSVKLGDQFPHNSIQHSEVVNETLRKWPLPRSKKAKQKAEAMHQAMLENMKTGKEWWRVRIGAEERDLRSLKPAKEPWSFPSKVKDELSEDSNEVSRWWLTYASGSAETATAILSSATGDGLSPEVVRDAIDREQACLVREAEDKLKAAENPLLVAALTCPPHRIHQLRAVARAKASPKPPGEKENEVHSQRSPQTLQSPQTQKLSHSPRAEQNLTNVEFSVKENAPVRIKKKRKPGKKKERAMAQHIESLEEQVAILRAQMAQKELEKLKASQQHSEVCEP